jgi:putative transposase
MDISAPSYRGYRFPAEIISHCVWLYFRFCLSFRDVQEMMLERGIQVSHEAIRLWTLKFGAEYARRLRGRIGGYGDTWHLDEVFCKVNGELVYLWRAVDQDGESLDVLVQKRRNAKAAKRFFRRLLKALRYGPRAIVTDKLSSYAAAREEVMPGVEHRRGGRLNNRAENSHQPTRERERRMRASSRSGTRSVSSQCMGRCRTTSVLVGIDCGLVIIGRSCTGASKTGDR